MPRASPSATATIRTSSRSEPDADEPRSTLLLGVGGGSPGRHGLVPRTPAPDRRSRPPRRPRPRWSRRRPPPPSLRGLRVSAAASASASARRPPRRPDRAAARAARPPPDRCSGARARAHACPRGRAGSRAWRAARRRGRRPRCARSSGECSGNVRSTPTPKDCLRTVNVSRTPSPWRLMTTPSKTCVRRRVPSMTWKWTRTRSPAWNCGTRRSCVRSRLSMTVLIARKNRESRRAVAEGAYGSEAPPSDSARRRDCASRHARMRA